MPTTRVLPGNSTALLLDCALSSHEQQRLVCAFPASAGVNWKLEKTLILQLRKTGPDTTGEGILTYIIAARENQ